MIVPLQVFPMSALFITIVLRGVGGERMGSDIYSLFYSIQTA